MSEKNKLELWVVERLAEIEKWVRPTKGSGNKNEIGDILSERFYVECKQKHTKANFILTRGEWLKLQKQLPLYNHKIPIWVIENKFGEKIVMINAEDFFRNEEKIL